MLMPLGFKLEHDEVVLKSMQQRLVKQKKAQKAASKITKNPIPEKPQLHAEKPTTQAVVT